MKPLAQLVRPNILALQPYSTARDEYAGGGIGVWLDANESPYDNGVNRYPDPHQRELKAQLAVLPRLQEELAKRDAEVSDLRGAQQGLQTKYGDLEQKYASCLSEGTKLKQE